MLRDAHAFEARGAALRREGLGLLFGPPVARQARGSRLHATLDYQEPPCGCEHTPHLPESGRHVLPVMHGFQRSHHGRPFVGKRQRFCSAPRPIDARVAPRNNAGDTQHHRGRINTDDAGTSPGGGSYRSARAATDVDDPVNIRYRGALDGQPGITASQEKHEKTHGRTADSAETRMVGVMIDDGCRRIGHRPRSCHFDRYAAGYLSAFAH